MGNDRTRNARILCIDDDGEEREETKMAIEEAMRELENRVVL